MPRTGVRSTQIGDEGVKRADLNVSAVGQSVVRKIVAGTGISLSSTGADAGTGDVTVNATGASPERALIMGKAGTIAASETDAADFVLCVPFNMTLKRIKVSCKAAPTGAMVVQIRRSTDMGASFSNFFGSATFSANSKVATSDPADVAVNEGDCLNFSVSTGSGTNILVEVIGA